MVLPTRSDAELVAAVAAGDLEALGELVRRHQERALAVATRLLGQADQAEDVVQEAFLRVRRAAGKYRPSAKFSTWLYRIVVNLCLDAMRHRKRQPLTLAQPPEGLGGDNPADDALTAEQIHRVRRAVLDLPDRQRAAVLLHRFEDLSAPKIAEVTGWSLKAVESVLVRAYANLRRMLAE